MEVGEGVGSWFEDNTRRIVSDGRDTLFWHNIWVGEIPLRIKFPRLYDLAVNKECSVEEMGRLGWEDGGREWGWRRRLLVGEESVREFSDYSVRGPYQFIATSDEPPDMTMFDDIWHNNISSNVSLFEWRLLWNRLPTKYNLVRQSVLHSNDTACAVGCGNSETTKHLFLGCELFSSLWSHVWNWLGISSVPPGELQHHFLQFTNMAGIPSFSRSFLMIIWFACVWVIWKERNICVFQNTASNPSIIIEKVKLNSFLWLKSKHVSFSYIYHDGWKHPLLCMGVHV